MPYKRRITALDKARVKAFNIANPGKAREYRNKPRSKILKSLYDAKKRCEDINNPQYGRKGILYLLDDCKEEAIAKLLPGYTAMLQAGIKPSLDRIDSNKHYSLDNIQALPQKENSAKH
jgi:hypothetical protein